MYVEFMASRAPKGIPAIRGKIYVIGIQGPINEQQWCQQLTELGMSSHQQDKTIQKYIAASIRGTHAVASSSEKQGNDG